MKHQHASDTDRILYEIERVRLLLNEFENVERLLTEIRDAVKVPGGAGHTVIHVTSARYDPHKEAVPMPNIDHMPDFVLPASNIDAGLAVVNPRRADGSRVEPGQETWSTSDAMSLPFEVLPYTKVLDQDGNEVLDPKDNLPLHVFNVRARTPLTPDPGVVASGVITWKALGMFDVDIKVAYGDPALGHAAITATQIPD